MDFNQLPPSDVPLARADRNSMIAHRQMVEKARKGRIDLYFLGDSITRRWGTCDKIWRPMLENWRSNFYGWNAGNFGWGGDSTQNILWRIQNGELDHVSPKVIVLMAGTNNIGSGHDADDVARGIAAILRTCQDKVPQAKIVLTAILPRNDNMAFMPAIDAANGILKTMADGDRVRFLNVNSRFADVNGKLFEGLTIDNLHLSVKGYQVGRMAFGRFFRSSLDRGPRPTTHPHLPATRAKPGIIRSLRRRPPARRKRQRLRPSRRSLDTPHRRVTGPGCDGRCWRS